MLCRMEVQSEKNWQICEDPKNTKRLKMILATEVSFSELEELVIILIMPHLHFDFKI